MGKSGGQGNGPVGTDAIDVDEDSWTVPAGWWRQTDPFRGRGPRRSIGPDPAETAASVVAELTERAGTAPDRGLRCPGSDPDLVRAARAQLGGPGGFAILKRRADPDVDPLGAAVVASLVACGAGWTHRARSGAFVDHWANAHGLAFAAEAVTLAARLWVDYRMASPVVGHPVGPVIRRAAVGDVGWRQAEPLARQLRALLAATDDTTYAEVVERLSGLRTTLGARAVTSYLAPSEQSWVVGTVDELTAAGVAAGSLAPLLTTVTTGAQAQAVITITGSGWAIGRDTSRAYSLAAHVGPDAAPVLAALFDGTSDATDRKRILGLLAQLPTDAAFDLLLDRLDQKYVGPVVLEAMARFPRRALRRLAAASAAATAGPNTSALEDLLRGHVVAHPELTARLRDDLDEAAAREVDGVAATLAERLPAAEVDRLPALLVTPPWTERRRLPQPVVIEGLARPTPARVVWKPGEQEAWAQTDTTGGWTYSADLDWRRYVALAANQGPRVVQAVALAPEEVARSLLYLRSGDTHGAGPALQRILARFGDDALAFVEHLVCQRPATLAQVLLPVEGSTVTAAMVDWYSRYRAVRPVAVSWFDRHAAAATRDLVPAALTKPGPERAAAEAALRVLDRSGHRADIDAATQAVGVEGVVEAIDAVLAVDPLQLLPARIPKTPAWCDPARLPQVLLADRTAALPADAVGHLCTMFALSKPGATYAGIDEVRAAVDPASLAGMVWGLLELWRAAGYPSKDGWVMEALGLVGDDATVRNLAPLIRAWPGESAHKRAVTGLDVLAAIGTDVALLHLHGIAEKVKFKALKVAARAKIDEVADGLGLSTDQLADRLVPDFGLDGDGSLVLDYGSRTFTVGFDEQLKPTVADADGSRRKALPKPGAKDDPQLAPAAYARFAGLRKDVRTVATDQVRRFEQAMVNGRRWTAAEHRALFVEHPLLWHLTRRLVWATFGADGELLASFRLAEDRTLADSTDTEVELGPDATVGIAHPLHLGDTVAPWAEVFADYEILQPFPQLGREVHHLTPEERDARVLDRFAGTKVPTGKVLGLTSRGWERGAPQDAGIENVVYKRVAERQAVVVDLDPGIVAGDALEWPEQSISGVWLNHGPADWGNPRGNLPFGLLDPVTASEVLRDLEGLAP